MNFTPRKKNTGPYPPKGVGYLPNIGQYSISCDFKFSNRLIFQQETSRDDWTLVWPINPCFIPNLSVDRMGANWALFNESGNYINRFCMILLFWQYLTKMLNMRSSEGAGKGKSKTGMKLLREDQVKPRTAVWSPFFLFSFSVHCFHTDFDFCSHPQQPNNPSLGGTGAQ